jgi:hypothetical protein
MTHTVIHHPRVAWDGARALVAAADSYRYIFVAAQLNDTFGEELARSFAQTHDRLLAGTPALVEAGMWRVRLQDLLNRRPDLAPALMEITRTADAR